MLGLRGVRLLTVLPELVVAHVRALAERPRTLQDEGLRPAPRAPGASRRGGSELTLARRASRRRLQGGERTAAIPCWGR